MAIRNDTAHLCSCQGTGSRYSLRPARGRRRRGETHEGEARMYLWLKLIHVSAVIAFLGNITTGLFWHRHAARTRDPRLLAFTMDGIIRSDRIFTVPGVIVILTAGIFAALPWKPPVPPARLSLLA